MFATPHTAVAAVAAPAPAVVQVPKLSSEERQCVDDLLDSLPDSSNQCVGFFAAMCARDELASLEDEALEAAMSLFRSLAGPAGEVFKVSVAVLLMHDMSCLALIPTRILFLLFVLLLVSH